MVKEHLCVMQSLMFAMLLSLLGIDADECFQLEEAEPPASAHFHSLENVFRLVRVDAFPAMRVRLEGLDLECFHGVSQR